MSINLNLGDCLEAMRAMPDNSYDLAIVDPPYGLGLKTVSKPSEKNKNSQQKFYKDLTSKQWDNEIPQEQYFTELKRVSQNFIIWGANYMLDFLGPTKCIVIWDKMTYIPTMSQYEFAFTSFNKHPKIVKINSNQLDRIHPTQKPVKLYEWLLDNYAKEGDRILDTHLGSGSIALACHNRGYSLDAYEIDEEYYNAATERLRVHKSQLTIF